LLCMRISAPKDRFTSLPAKQPLAERADHTEDHSLRGEGTSHTGRTLKRLLRSRHGKNSTPLAGSCMRRSPPQDCWCELRLSFEILRSGTVLDYRSRSSTSRQST
jgi:hypothetical protein